MKKYIDGNGKKHCWKRAKRKLFHKMKKKGLVEGQPKQHKFNELLKRYYQ